MDLDNTDKLAEFRREAQRLGIAVEPPSINRSGVAVRGRAHGRAGAIRYALAAIKGVGRERRRSRSSRRAATRPFRGLADLAQRINPRLVNKRTLESLIAAGALDEHRARPRPGDARRVEPMMALAQRAAEAETGGSARHVRRRRRDRASSCASRSTSPGRWPIGCKREYEAVGFFLSGHPLDEYGELLEQAAGAELGRVLPRGARRHGARRRGSPPACSTAQERRTKTGNKMGIVNLSDQTGHFEAILFSEGLGHYRELLEPGRPLVLQLQASLEGDDVRARIQTAEPLDEAVAKHRNGMRDLPARRRARSASQRAAAPARCAGEGEVSLILHPRRGGREVEVKLRGRTRPRRRSPARCARCRAWCRSR